MRQSVLRIGSALALTLGIALAGASAARAESIMKECGTAWQAVKAAGTTNGQTWQEFLKGCRAQHQGGAARLRRPLLNSRPARSFRGSNPPPRQRLRPRRLQTKASWPRADSSGSRRKPRGQPAGRPGHSS